MDQLIPFPTTPPARREPPRTRRAASSTVPDFGKRFRNLVAFAIAHPQAVRLFDALELHRRDAEQHFSNLLALLTGSWHNDHPLATVLARWSRLSADTKYAVSLLAEAADPTSDEGQRQWRLVTALERFCASRLTRSETAAIATALLRTAGSGNSRMNHGADDTTASIAHVVATLDDDSARLVLMVATGLATGRDETERGTATIRAVAAIARVLSSADVTRLIQSCVRILGARATAPTSDVGRSTNSEIPAV